MGPNVGTPDWQSKSKLREKMINFSKEAEYANKQRLVNQKPAIKPPLQKRRFGVDGPLWDMA